MESRPLDAGMWDLGQRYDIRSHRVMFIGLWFYEISLR